jgi:trk system potassium uptake protein
MILTIIIGSIFYFISFLGKDKPLNYSRAILLTALSFIILPLLSSISYLPYTNFINSLFESISGYTTTGLSIFNTINHLPKSLILWRVTTQWVGGFGIILVFLYIFTLLRQSKSADENISISYSLFKSQGMEKSEDTFRKTLQFFGLIYLGITIIGIILLFISGLSFYESIVISFGSISTGGFSATDSFYSNPVQLAIISIIMILGSISFVAHTKLLNRKFLDFFSNIELRMLFILIISFILLSKITNENLGIIIFNIISAITTTGYATTDLSGLSLYFLQIIILCMIIGGSAGSTSGGIKLNRFYILFRSIGWAIKRFTLPSSAIISYKIREKTVEIEEIFLIQVFFFVYLMLLFVSTIFFILMGYSLMESVFQVSSALGTVGLSTIQIEAVPIIGKLILMILMLFGRLEIFPLLILIYNLFSKKQ